MKPVIIQTLFRNMRNRIRLPDPPSDDATPKRKDKTGQIMIAVFVIAIVFCFLL